MLKHVTGNSSRHQRSDDINVKAVLLPPADWYGEDLRFGFEDIGAASLKKSADIGHIRLNGTLPKEENMRNALRAAAELKVLSAGRANRRRQLDAAALRTFMRIDGVPDSGLNLL